MAKSGLAILSVVFFTAWLILILNARGPFQDTHGTDPLAMINVLFPSFWIIIFSFAILSYIVIRREFDDQRLHLLFLGEMSLVLFFTPFLISGFSWDPDSLYHGGIGQYMPEILGGSDVAFMKYAKSYPMSYLLTYCARSVLGIGLVDYTLYLYPILSNVVTAALAYIFLKRLVGPRMSFIAMTVAMPTMHWVMPHVSPFSTGTIFTFGLLILLTMYGNRARLLFLGLASVLVLTHPVSPISLSVFMIAVVVVQVLNRIMHLGLIDLGFRDLLKRVSLKMILFVAIIYLIWTMLWVRTIYESVWYAIRSFVTLRFIEELMNAASFTTSGFLFKDIYTTQLSVYAVLLVFPVICIIINLRRWNFRRNGRPVNHIEALFAIVSLAYVAFSYALYLAGRDHHLLADGLIYFSIMASVSMGFVLLSRTHGSVSPRLKSLCFLSLLVFLYASFPVVSFSKEAYNTYVPSQDAGLTFVAGNVDAYDNTLAMSSDQQFVPYLNMSRSIGLLSLRATNFPPDLNKTKPDYIVIHANAFFVRALRYDLSLDDNKITRVTDYLENSIHYNRVYSNRDFDLYYLSNLTAYVG